MTKRQAIEATQEQIKEILDYFMGKYRIDILSKIFPHGEEWKLCDKYKIQNSCNNCPVYKAEGNRCFDYYSVYRNGYKMLMEYVGHRFFDKTTINKYNQDKKEQIIIYYLSVY